MTIYKNNPAELNNIAERKNLQERTCTNDTNKGKLCNKSYRISMKVCYLKIKEHIENVTKVKIMNSL